MYRLIGLLILASLTLTPAPQPMRLSQRSAAIAGIVTDQDGNPLMGITVRVESIINDLYSKTTVTNEKGEFIITGLEVGLYDVAVISTNGFPVRRTVSTIPGRITKTNFQIEGLLPRSSQNIEQQISKAVDKAENTVGKKKSKLALIKYNQQGTTIEGYNANKVITTLDSGKRQLLDSLDRKELYGLRAYINESYPSDSELKFVGEINGRAVASRESSELLFNKLKLFFETLRRNKNIVELCISSNPQGATFELRTYPDGLEPITTICTTNCCDNVYRGKYTYQVVKYGYKVKLYVLNLMNVGDKIKLDCLLYETHRLYGPDPCSIH